MFDKVVLGFLNGGGRPLDGSNFDDDAWGAASESEISISSLMSGDDGGAGRLGLACENMGARVASFDDFPAPRLAFPFDVPLMSAASVAIKYRLHPESRWPLMFFSRT